MVAHLNCLVHHGLFLNKLFIADELINQVAQRIRINLFRVLHFVNCGDIFLSVSFKLIQRDFDTYQVEMPVIYIDILISMFEWT